MNKSGRSDKRVSNLEAALPRACARLLALLAEPQAYALPDPTQEGMLVVRRARGAVSLGSGRFPAAAAEALVRRDLATAQARPQGGALYRLSDAGAAHLRRRAASTPEDRYLEQNQDRVEAQVEVGGQRVQVRRDAAESPLEWLRRHKGRAGAPLIDAAGFEAGERLRRDLTLSGMLPSVTLNWSAVPSSPGSGAAGPANATDTAVAARQRATRALDAVGSEFSGLLVDLCGFLKGLERIEQERGWPPRSAKVVVTLALARLADHYGLQGSAQGPAGSRGVRAWHAAPTESSPALGKERA